ncbi:hypothetical protein GGR34_003488 [Microvirga flocculans]|uniref:Uncharacterized protein n=1 Tax=Microvirga flocculans TaxID=217168 RepID=A0A7W6N9J6_9HYPH|nr:hypothetical protein [Microvirga flocculans]MBB4041807.1 hypothetical protein [Microvirga flocculans]
MADVKSQEKADRLKAALKENLKRRKAQARGRQAARASGTEGGSSSVSTERDKPSD